MLKYAAYLGIFILVVHSLAIYNAWYVSINGFDIPMHMLAGLWVGLILAHFFGHKMALFDPKRSFWGTFLFVLGTTLMVGVFWEFYEFFISQLAPLFWHVFVKGNMELGDTLKDILDDMIGGSAAGIISFFYFKKEK